MHPVSPSLRPSPLPLLTCDLSIVCLFQNVLQLESYSAEPVPSFPLLGPWAQARATGRVKPLWSPQTFSRPEHQRWGAAGGRAPVSRPGPPPRGQAQRLYLSWAGAGEEEMEVWASGRLSLRPLFGAPPNHWWKL